MWVCSSQNQCHRPGSQLSPPHSPNLPGVPSRALLSQPTLPSAAQVLPAPAKPLPGQNMSIPCVSQCPPLAGTIFFSTGPGTPSCLHSPSHHSPPST